MRPPPLHIVWLVSLASDSLRYFLAAGGAFFFFWVLGRERYRPRLVQKKYADAAKMMHDLRWSLSTILVFGTSGVFLYWGGHHNIFRRYEDISDYGWPWFFARPEIV